jgi:hypothetical protein
MDDVVWAPKWDGSELKDFNKSMFIVKFLSENNNMKYCKFTYHNRIICCGYKKANDVTPCIFDEFSTIFNVRKVGTHFALIRKKYYIFYRINYDQQRDRIKEDTILSKLSEEKKLSLLDSTKEIIQKIYVLYEILGMYTGDNYICIRKTHNIEYVIRYKMMCINDTIYMDNDFVIPDVSYKLWFKDEDHFYITMKKICPVDEYSINSYVLSINDKMMKIVKRIDKKYIYLVSVIINRIKDRLELLNI